MASLEQKLVEYGLHEYEAKLYLAGMELGPSPVQVIAKKAGINRVSAYTFIKTLMDRGLMSSYEQGKRTMYAASEPQRLLQVFENQKRQLEDLEKDFNKVLPEFKSAYNASADKPVVRYYEGMEGALAMNEEMLEGRDEIIEMVYNSDTIREYIPEKIRQDLVRKRVERNITTKVIYSKADGEVKSSADGERFKLDDSTYPIKADITIYHNKVRFITFSSKMSGIVIENSDVADTMRTLFYLSIKNIRKT